MIEGYFGLFSIITGGIIGVVGAVFTVRSSLVKSNITALKELNETLTTQRDNAEEEKEKIRTERERLVTESARLQGENKTLREIATQTPEILLLTKEVSRNNREMGVVAKEIARLATTIESHFMEKTK